MLYRMIGEEKDDIPATTVAYKTSYREAQNRISVSAWNILVQEKNIFEGKTGSTVEFFCQSNCSKNYKILLTTS